MADMIGVQEGELAVTGPTPARVSGAAAEGRFADLARRWERETAFCSSASEIVGHPAYQEIIGLGRAAVPLIIAELRRGPNHWAHALTRITGEDPVRPEDQGRLDAMAGAWLRWADERGI